MNVLFSGVLVGIIDDFLCLLKTLLKERAAEVFSCKETTNSSNCSSILTKLFKT